VKHQLESEITRMLWLWPRISVRAVASSAIVIPVDIKHRACIPFCPRFSQDRVNFHKKPGGDIAGMADPTWPNKRDIRY